MVARALLIAVLSLLAGLFWPASSEAQHTLYVVDDEFVGDGPGDVAFVPGRNDVFVVSRFNSGEAVTFRRNRNGTVTITGSSPVGPEPRAMAFAHGGSIALIVNSIANEIGVFAVRPDGLHEINRVPSGGLNPYDVAVGFNDIVVVANRDSDQINTFHVDRRGRITPLAQAAAGIDPHVVSVSRSRGLVAVANQTDRTISMFELNRRGELAPMSTVPLDNMTPRTLTWRGRTLFVALDAPSPLEDVIRAFYVNRRGQIEQRGDTPAGAFLTDLEANADGLFAVTVNRNNPADPTAARDEVRAYRFDGTELTLEASVQTPGVPPSFKQVAARRGRGGATHVVATEYQGGWLRSLLYGRDEQ